MNIVAGYIKRFADCDAVTTKSTKELMKDYGCRRVLARGISAKKDFCGTLFVKDVTRVLQK